MCMFIKKIVIKKFQRKKKVWAEVLRVTYFLLIKLIPCVGEMEFSVDGHCENYFSIVL